jgi:hypothetical protein
MALMGKLLLLLLLLLWGLLRGELPLALPRWSAVPFSMLLMMTVVQG